MPTKKKKVRKGLKGTTSQTLACKTITITRRECL